MSDHVPDRPASGGGSNNFNLMRLVLATAVIVSHAWPLHYGMAVTEPVERISGLAVSALAVNAFFIISGFLITGSWLSEPHLGRFLLKRITRIYPAFLIASLLVAFVVQPWAAGWKEYFAVVEPRLIGERLLALKFETPRMLLAQQGIFRPVAGQLWTIQVEFICYLAALVCGLLGVLKSPWKVTSLFVVMTLFYSFGRYLPALTSIHEGPWSPEPISLLRFMMFFLAGATAWMWRDKVRLLPGGAVVAVVLCLLSLMVPSMVEIVQAVAGAYLIFFLAFTSLPVRMFWAQSVDISYGTYLYGYPAQFFLAFFYPHLSFLGHLFLSLVIAYALGFLSWIYIEKPILMAVRRPNGRFVNEVPTPVH